MPIKTILNVLGDDEHTANRLGTARALAERFGADLIALHVTPPILVPVGLAEGTAFAGAELQEAHARISARVTERLKQVFRDVCEPPKVPSRWHHVDGDPGLEVPRLARTADLTVIAREASVGLDAMAPSVAEQTALGAGGPVLMLPPGSFGGTLGRSVVVGWIGTREAARAVHDALPFLAEAEAVRVVTLGDEGRHGLEAAVSLLRRHGIDATAHREPDGSDAGQRLLTLAAEDGADLLVMGAYGRSRMRELILGGATRSVLSGSTIPLLLSA